MLGQGGQLRSMHHYYPGPAQCKLVRAEYQIVEAPGIQHVEVPVRINKLQGTRSRVRDEVNIFFFNLPNPSIRIRTWGLCLSL
jgi:hypothetical protein